MPNYCSNVIIVFGKVSKMEAFYNAIEEEEKHGEKVYRFVSFESTVPVQGGSNLETWGTKWDVYEPEAILCTPKKYKIRCLTAWSPPLKWALECAKKFEVNIRVAFVEKGVAFYGSALFNSNGRKELFEAIIDSKDYKVERDEEDDEEETVVVGKKLKKFMDKYGLVSFGG